MLPRDAVDATIAEALRAKPHTVAAAGGDGTVSSVAAAVAGSATPFGILPLGTLNHFAKDLHIPLDLAQAVHTIASRHIVVVDAAQVNGRVFVNNSSIGLYPSVVERREALRKQGHRKWPAFAMAATQVLSRSEDVSVRLNVDGRQIVTRTPFVFVPVRAPARTCIGELRVCIYFEKNLVQSQLVRATVGSNQRAQLGQSALIDYSLTAGFARLATRGSFPGVLDSQRSVREGSRGWPGRTSR